MKKLIAVVLVLGIVFSMFSVTAISTAAASAPSAEATADSAESVGAPPSNADEYSEIGLGESNTETALIKRKFTASKPMIVKLTATGSKVYTVNVAGETQTPNYFDYTTNENGKEYYLVKNSWGETGDYKGIWYMTKAYIALNTMDYLVNKNAIPAEIRKKLGI